MQSHTCGVAGKKREDCFTRRRARAINLISLQPAAPKAHTPDASSFAAPLPRGHARGLATCCERNDNERRERRSARKWGERSSATVLYASPLRARHLARACAFPERRRDRAKLAAGRQCRATPRPIRDVFLCTWDGVREWHASTRRETGSRSTNSNGSSSRFRTDNHNPDSRRECR